MLPKIQDLKPIFMMEMIKQLFKRENPLEYFLEPPSDEDDWSSWRNQWGTIAEQLFSKEEQENFAPLVAKYLPKLTKFKQINPVTRSMFSFFKQHGQATIYKVFNWTYLVKYYSHGEWCYVLFGEHDFRINPRIFAEHVASRHANGKGKIHPGWIFLTERLTRALQETYDRASRDFDEACVVTTDGKHIITAEKVRIVHADGTMDEVDASLFREKKIMFPDPEQGGNWASNTVDKNAVQSMTEHVKWLFNNRPKHGGFFLRPWDKGGFAPIFFVRERLVPTGLTLRIQ